MRQACAVHLHLVVVFFCWLTRPWLGGGKNNECIAKYTLASYYSLKIKILSFPSFIFTFNLRGKLMLQSEKLEKSFNI